MNLTRIVVGIWLLGHVHSGTQAATETKAPSSISPACKELKPVWDLEIGSPSKWGNPKSGLQQYSSWLNEINQASKTADYYTYDKVLVHEPKKVVEVLKTHMGVEEFNPDSPPQNSPIIGSWKPTDQDLRSTYLMQPDLKKEFDKTRSTLKRTRARYLGLTDEYCIPMTTGTNSTTRYCNDSSGQAGEGNAIYLTCQRNQCSTSQNIQKKPVPGFLTASDFFGMIKFSTLRVASNLKEEMELEDAILQNEFATDLANRLEKTSKVFLNLASCIGFAKDVIDPSKTIHWFSSSYRWTFGPPSCVKVYEALAESFQETYQLVHPEKSIEELDLISDVAREYRGNVASVGSISATRSRVKTVQTTAKLGQELSHVQPVIKYTKQVLDHPVVKQSLETIKNNLERAKKLIKDSWPIVLKAGREGVLAARVPANVPSAPNTPAFKIQGVNPEYLKQQALNKDVRSATLSALGSVLIELGTHVKNFQNARRADKNRLYQETLDQYGQDRAALYEFKQEAYAPLAVVEFAEKDLERIWAEFQTYGALWETKINTVVDTDQINNCGFELPNPIRKKYDTQNHL